jgi:dolichyl-phosphate-mannose-protein mannosyltransferase
MQEVRGRFGQLASRYVHLLQQGRRPSTSSYSLESKIMEHLLHRRPGAARPPLAARNIRDAIALVLALAIAATFVAILLHGIDFPLRTGRDEPIKAKQILADYYNHHHPLLMLHLARAGNVVAGFTDRQGAVELGRIFAVLAGGFAIFATFLLARKVLPTPVALAACLATAVVPAMTAHARYFKEDIFALPFILFSLVILIETLKTPTRTRGLLLGATIGLAASAKFVGAIALPFAVAVLLIDAWGKDDWQIRPRLAGLVTIVAVGVLALVELPAIWEFSVFSSSLSHNLHRVNEGDGIPLPIDLTYGIFHLRESLLPSLGPPLLVLGLLGLTTPWLTPPQRRQPVFIIVAFALLWYAVHEFTPLKPYPNFERYMVPLAPLIIILGATFIYELAQRRFPAWGSLIAAAAIVAAAAPALYMSLRIAGPAGEDPRGIVPGVVLRDTPGAAFDKYTRLDTSRASSEAKAVFDRYTGRESSQALSKATTSNIFVTSSFAYERFARPNANERGPSSTKPAAYAAIFTLPYIQVSNGRPAFGWFNPVMRIVALDGDTDHLKSIATALTAAAPSLSVRLANAGAPLEQR